jgi:agmatine deiminase
LMYGFGFQAQTQTPEEIYQFQTRTHMVSPDELGRMHERGINFVPTPPPGGQVRSIAEFEPMEGVIVGYSGTFGIPFSLIAQMAEVATVYTIVPSANAENTVRNQYIANGVDINNCVFVRGPLNSYWARDYSPWFIADSAHQVAIVDFPYNRPRPNDDAVPALMAAELGLPLYGMNLLHTGGNFMCDGLGRAASTTLVQDENQSLSSAQINALMYDYLGIDTYYTIDDPMNAYIDHIDCWAKFLAPDKILLGEVPVNDPRYPDYEAIATFLAGETSPYGTPYEVYRVYSPNGQPYTNSLILNNKVFLPVVTTYGSPWNDSAVAVYQRAMPGYDVVGIYALANRPWASTDALHCRVHEMPDRGMLYIRHLPKKGDVSQQSGYAISAEVIPYSGHPVIADSIQIHYRYNEGPWHATPMFPDTAFVWGGIIPDSAAGVRISYTIRAADQSGRGENHPYIGKPGAHHFEVKGNISVNAPEPRKRELLVFPNPCDHKVYAAIPEQMPGVVTVNLFNITGQRLLTEVLSSPSILFKEGVDVIALEPGIYLMEVIHGSSRYLNKIMVVRQ